MIAKRRSQTQRTGAMTPNNRTTAQDRYWRTFLRKSGEALDLGGKALTAAGAAGVLAPLATKAVLRIPTAAILATILVGIAFVLAGIHLQALADRSKPDE